MSYIYRENSVDSALPEERLLPGGNFTLSWHNLSVWVRKKDETRSSFLSTKYNDVRILNKLNGIAEPGTLVAIMGPSGAGKTTLLATISQRLQGDMTGTILVNGKSVSAKLMVKLSGFVPQHDLTINSLTVLEHMQLMARLKMDKRLRTSSRNRRVLSLITDLGLAKCSHTRLSELSGGETKKVSLAVQMLTDPPLLFCDEPTTGLDSYNAGMVVEKLRQLALRGKTVICSIHQPASGVFDLFHSVILLAPGGELAYQGDPQQSFQYFSSLNLICPESYNLAEFVVSQLAITDDPESQAHVAWLCAQFHVSTAGQQYNKKLKKALAVASSGEKTINSFNEIEDDEFQKYKSIQTPSMGTQLYWLVWRS